MKKMVQGKLYLVGTPDGPDALDGWGGFALPANTAAHAAEGVVKDAEGVFVVPAPDGSQIAIIWSDRKNAVSARIPIQRAKAFVAALAVMVEACGHRDALRGTEGTA